MRILIAGYGNIGRAIDTLIRHSTSTIVSSIVLCDIKLDGMKVQQWLKHYHSTIDTVVNLTGEPSQKILALCCKYRLNYIDSGLDIAENDCRTLHQAFEDLCMLPINVTALIGFGMNPGLVEYIYYLNASSARHAAIELEYDTATWGLQEERKVFNTWSTLSYFKEAVLYTPYYYHKANTTQFLTSPGINIDFALTIDGGTRTFNLIPHEEVVSMGLANPYCDYCAFLYQAPLAMQQFLKQHSHTLQLHDMKSIPTPDDDIMGHDVMGMLIYNHQRLTYHFNKAAHAVCLARYRDRNNKGVNATSWQVACGVYVAIELLPLLKPKIYTISDLAANYSTQIETILSELQFAIHTQELDPQLFGWDKVARFFNHENK